MFLWRWFSRFCGDGLRVPAPAFPALGLSNWFLVPKFIVPL